MATVNRTDLEGGKSIPAGDYTLEIISGNHVEKPTYKKALLNTVIREPKEMNGQKFTLGLFYDAMLAKLLLACGKDLDDVFQGGNEVDTGKLFDILKGQIIQVRIGLKNGWNNLADVLEDKKLEEKI